MHYGYAASLGITRSANRKNRWLRAPATNDPGGLRSPNSPAVPQSAPGFLLPSAAKLSKAARSPRSTIASSRDRFGVGLLESVLQRRHLRPVRRYSSGRFGIGRGAGATPAPTRLRVRSRPSCSSRAASRAADPPSSENHGDDAGKSPARICGAKPNGELLDHDPLGSAPAGKHGFYSYVRCFPVGPVEASFTRGRPHGPGSPAGDLPHFASDAHEGQHAQGAA